MAPPRPLRGAKRRRRARTAPPPSWKLLNYAPRYSGRTTLGSDVGRVVSKAAHDSYRSAVTATWLGEAWPTKTHPARTATGRRRGSGPSRPRPGFAPQRLSVGERSPPPRNPRVAAANRQPESQPTRVRVNPSPGQRTPVASKCFTAIPSQMRAKSQERN